MEYLISTDKAKIDVDAVHDYLCHRSYWAKGRNLEKVMISIENSLCFGMYDSEGTMLAFGRVVTDNVVFAYLMDFFVFEAYQGKGLGTKLARYIFELPELQVRLWFLATASAHSFYERFGFSALDDPHRYMFKRDENQH